MAEWFSTLIFRALNRLASHRCCFETSLGHMLDKLAGGQVVLLRDLPFLPHLIIDSKLVK